MTIKEYIQMEFSAFGITEAQILDVLSSSSFSADDECSYIDLTDRQNLCLDILEAVLFRPRLQSISESGISMSYDYDGIGKWYLYLCKKLGRKPNDEVISMLGISTITDKTDLW